MQKWIGVLGIMGSIMTDNGDEFSSDEMRQVMSVLKVRVSTTAAESPFQIGLCERVHAITDMMLLKLEEENGRTDSQILLCLVNMTHNSLQKLNGYSSHQLVFGQNLNLPGIMTDRLPALEELLTVKCLQSISIPKQEKHTFKHKQMNSSLRKHVCAIYCNISRL